MPKQKKLDIPVLRWNHEYPRFDAHDLRESGYSSEESEVESPGNSEQALGFEEEVQPHEGTTQGQEGESFS